MREEIHLNFFTLKDATGGGKRKLEHKSKDMSNSMIRYDEV